VFHL